MWQFLPFENLKYVTSTAPCFTGKFKIAYFITQINPHMHEILVQLYYMKWVPRDPQKDPLN